MSRPCPPKIFKCKVCNFETRKKDHWERHLQTRKHISVMNSKKHSCEACNYYTNSKSDYTKHLQTTKHKNMVNEPTKSNANANSEDAHLIKELLVKQSALMEKIVEMEELKEKRNVDLETIVSNMGQNNSITNSHYFLFLFT